MQQEELSRSILGMIDHYRDAMVTFMKDLIRIPSESCQEGKVIERIQEEMIHLGFPEVRIDPMGNILGRIGSGKRIIAFDAHVDTVGVGNRDEWRRDPYGGEMEDGIIYGLGASDEKGAMVSMVYAGVVMKELGLYDDFSLYMVGSIQEEDCDGLCWQYIIQEDKIRPELVVITEPTNLNIYLGHRGRMEMEVITEGISCHGSAPERGDNSLYKMAPIISAMENFNGRLLPHPVLGKGSIAVTHIHNETPSLCAIPNKTKIHLDRRLTKGEDKELAIQQIEELIEELGLEAKVEILTYDRPSYKGVIYPTEKYYPTWLIEKSHPSVVAAVKTFEALFKRKPILDYWTFSTNGVSIMGLFGIPCIGFGPAHEIHAHSVADQVPIDHLLKASAFYTLLPRFL